MISKRHTLIALAALFLAGCDAAAQNRVQAPAPKQASPPPLTVVELFTSQGCSSCPPANENFARLTDRPDILALSFGVDYWDYLGWADTFASPDYTKRQRDYARGLGSPNVYTPQIVINGRAHIVGARRGQIERSITTTRALPAGPAITLTPNNVAVASAAGVVGASIWLVRYDPRVVQVPIRRGENNGKTLPHTNVVRSLVKVATFDGQSGSWRLPASTDPAFKSAIIVQGANGGPILAAAKL